MNNYQGIAFSFSGTEGVDYAIEQLCHDEGLQPRAVVYLKGSTDITLTHTALNSIKKDPLNNNFVEIGTAGYGGDSGKVGIIRYRIDTRHQSYYKGYSAEQGAVTNLYDAYSAPFALDDLEYETGVSVVGTTGDNGVARTRANLATHYTRGMLDDAGEEWHTIDVWDDDEWLLLDWPSIKTEYLCSDARTVFVIVNPKAATLKITATGDAEYITREPVAWNNTNVVEQRTVFCAGTGGVSFDLTDMDSRDIHYRIVSDPNDDVTAYTDSGATTVSLDESDFAVGTRYLQWYADGTPANTRTREIIRLPNTPTATDYPSNGESHGYIFCNGEDNYTAIDSRLNRSPYLSAWNAIKTDAYELAQTLWDTHQNKRWPAGNLSNPVDGSYVNLFTALREGSTYTVTGQSKTCLEYGIEMLKQCPITKADPIGWEKIHASGPSPGGELIGAGYNINNVPINLARGYDIAVGHFRADQVSGGLTAVEDYAVREQISKYAFLGASCGQGYPLIDLGEMWYNADMLPMYWIGACMPSYDDPVHGVSGFDGVTSGRANTPFPTDTYTWWDLVAVRPAIGTFPEYCHRFDMEDPKLVTSAGNWGGNNGGYANQMRGTLEHAVLCQSVFAPSESELTDIELFMERTQDNIATDGDGDLIYQTHPILGHAAIATLGVNCVLDIKTPSSGSLTEAQVIANGGLDALVWYDDTYTEATIPVVPIPSHFGRIYESTISLTLTCPTPDAVIYYTTDGSPADNTGTVYAGPIAINTTTRVRGVAQVTGGDPSVELDATYTIDLSGVPSPPINLVVSF